MKKFFMFLTISAFQFSAIAQSGKEPYMTKSLSNESVKNVQVETTGGNISVSGVPASEARIEVYISGNNGKNNLSKEEIQQRLNDKYDLNVSVVSNKLVAIAKQKSRITDWKKSLNISFKIFVPKEVATDLSTSGGNIGLSNLSGDQDFSTSGGNLGIDNVSGDLKGTTSGGNINLANSNNNIDLSTSGGNINAKNCNGDLRLSTSGGSLNLEGLTGKVNASTSGGNVHGENIGGELIARTSGGNIRLNDLSCSLETSTSGGHIDVVFTQPGKYIKISNSGGNVEVTLPKNTGFDVDLSGDLANMHLENFSGKIDENEIYGKLNDGGVPLKVDAGSGKVHLTMK
jgi:DUF4097 and DUF4098 domain-containing protein YvlB